MTVNPQNSAPGTDRNERWTGLMTAAQRGDRVAYARLLGEISPRIRAIAGRTFRDRRDVDDVVQDVLLTLHAIRETYDPSRPFSPWLHGVVKHRVADRIRSRGRIWSREVALPEDHETSSAFATNAPDALEWSSRSLKAAIDGLPSGQKQAVTLLKLHEMSLKEASATSGMSVVALKVACHRALKSLRVRLSMETKTS